MRTAVFSHGNPSSLPAPPHPQWHNLSLDIMCSLFLTQLPTDIQQILLVADAPLEQLSLKADIGIPRSPGHRAFQVCAEASYMGMCTLPASLPHPFAATAWRRRGSLIQALLNTEPESQPPPAQCSTQHSSRRLRHCHRCCPPTTSG